MSKNQGTSAGTLLFVVALPEKYDAYDTPGFQYGDSTPKN